MYKIALVQNQSEMYHYWYADARKYLESKEYDYEMFTASNINSLARGLKSGSFQCVIFATNAFNDKTIYDAVESEEFIASFKAFMMAGNGCLVLNQIKIAQNKLPLSFLKGVNDAVLPPSLVYRNEKESVFEGRNFKFSGTKNHLLSFYPVEIDIKKVHDACLNHSGRQGTYWYYWDKMRPDLWDVLIEDDGRALVVYSNENYNYRIVLSSLLLDWQENYDLLDNILCWLVKKRQLTAIIRQNDVVNDGFSYFMRSLEAERFPHKVYDIEDSDLLRLRIEQGVHAVVIADPNINYSMLAVDLRKIIKQKTDNGSLKYIEFSDTDEIDSFLVSGKNKTSTQLFRELEPAISAEMLTGYIDGSFWSTVETLQALCEIEKIKEINKVNVGLDKNAMQNIFTLTKKREKQGSYDDVVGTTEALLWLKTRLLDKHDSRVNDTLNWLMNYANMDLRDKLSVYTTIIELGLDNGNVEDKLRKLLYRLDINLLDGIRLAHLLRSLKVLRDSHIVCDMLESVVTTLKSQQNKGCWIDLDTTATIVTNLINLNEFIFSEDFNLSNPLLRVFTAISRDISCMLFDAIIYIQKNRKIVDAKDVIYPWGNKIHTSIKCILAWIKFDSTISMPVEEIKKLLHSYSNDAHFNIANESTVRTVERMRDENLQLKNEVEKARRRDPQSVRNVIARSARDLIFMICVYATFMFSAILIYLTVSKGSKGTITDFWNILWKFWSLHSTFLVAPALKIYKNIKELKQSESGKKN